MDKQLSVGEASQAEEIATVKTPWQSGLECSCDNKEARGWNKVSHGWVVEDEVREGPEI